MVIKNATRKPDRRKKPVKMSIAIVKQNNRVFVKADEEIKRILETCKVTRIKPHLSCAVVINNVELWRKRNEEAKKSEHLVHVQ